MALAALKRMKTQTAEPAAAPQPGNVSVRELAKSLTKAPATASTEDGTTEAGGQAGTREVPPPKKRKGEPTAEETQTPEEQTEGTGTETQAEDTTAEATETTTEEAPVEERTESTEGNEGNEAPSIGDEASKRLDTELAPLIQELQAAGAKGALQILQKRIPKLVDQRDTERNGRLAAEEQVGQLRKELQEARSQKPEAGGQSNGNGAMHPAVARVTGELNQVDHWLSWCEDNADGGTVPNGKDTVELNAQQVKSLRSQLERERTELLVRKSQTESEARAEYQQAYKEHHTTAVSHYAWMRNTNSPEAQEAQAILKAAPGFKAFPDYELMLGDFITGKQLRLAKAKANGNGTVKRPAPQREPTRVVAEPPGSVATRKAPEKAKKEEADSQFRKSGSTRDLASSFAASRRASRSAE